MRRRAMAQMSNPGMPFGFPDTSSLVYAPGWQPNSPGESHLNPNPEFRLIPWPSAVPVLSMLANFGGRAQLRAVPAVNNSTTVLPTNYLFLTGFVGKSRG